MPPTVLDPCFGAFTIPGTGITLPVNFEDLVSRITLETAYGPKVTLDKPFKAGPPNPYLSRLQPRVTVEVKGVAQPLVSAPYGDPPETIWPQLVAGGAVVGGILVLLAGVGVYHLVRRGL